MRYVIQHCPPNPTLEYAKKVLSQVPSNSGEIWAIGGGSTIDVAKWVAKECNLPLTVLPTTAGTGSEVTRFVVLTVNGKKTTFSDEKYIPARYILEPMLVTTLPELHTLSSGLDALSQSLESYWSKNATRTSRKHAKESIRLVIKYLCKSLKHPENLEYRKHMMIAANLSGRAINITKTNVCHAISYPLTELYGIPHGIACAMSLQYFAKDAIGLDLTKFFAKLPMPTYTIDIQKIADIAITSPKLDDYPKQVNYENIIDSLI